MACKAVGGARTDFETIPAVPVDKRAELVGRGLQAGWWS